MERDRMEAKKKPPPIIQPVKCRGCIWGRWQDTVQICSFPKCPKENGEKTK
jgi:predicted Zn-ribbon and HTH transcriptional regulator